MLLLVAMTTRSTKVHQNSETDTKHEHRDRAIFLPCFQPARFSFFISARHCKGR